MGWYLYQHFNCVPMVWLILLLLMISLTLVDDIFESSTWCCLHKLHAFHILWLVLTCLTRTASQKLNLIVIRSAIPLNNINMICLLTWCNLTAAHVSICTNAAGAAVPWFHQQPFPSVKKFQNMKLLKSGMSLSAPLQLMANILNYKTQGKWWFELYIQSFF